MQWTFLFIPMLKKEKHIVVPGKPTESHLPVHTQQKNYGNHNKPKYMAPKF